MTNDMTVVEGRTVEGVAECERSAETGTLFRHSGSVTALDAYAQSVTGFGKSWYNCAYACNEPMLITDLSTLTSACFHWS